MSNQADGEGLTGESMDTDTECTQKEKALREFAERFETMLNSVAEHMSMMDRELNILWVNETAKSIFGDDLVGRKCYEVYHKTAKPCEPCITLQTFKDGKTHEHDTQAVDKNGEVIWFHCAASVALRDNEGEPRTVIEISRDVTELKRVAAALRESEAKYRALTDDVLDSSGVGFLILDAEDRVVWMNRAMEYFLGLQRNEILGKDMKQLINNKIKHLFEDPERFAQKILATYESNTYLESLECHILPNDGKKNRWLEHWSQPIRSGLYAGGRIGHYTDITKRKKGEEGLERRNQEMALLNNISRMLTSTLDLNQVLSSVLDQVRRLLNAIACSVWLVEQNTNELVCHHCTGPHKETVTGWRLPPGVGLVGLAVESGKSVVVADTRTHEHHFKGIDEASGWEVRSVLAVPLMIKEKLIGAIEVVDADVNRFKPYDLELVEPLAASASIAIENARLYKALQEELAERERAKAKLERTLKKLRKAMNGTIKLLASTVEIKDPYTAGHQQRTADLARSIGVQMGLSEKRIDRIRLAGLIHDLGKMAVPAEILSKPTRLSETEFELIKIHPQVAFDVLKNTDFSWPIAQIVYQHHERVNGSGYPQGLSGKEILLEAKVLAVADTVEAMASDRPYRPGLGITTALDEISDKKGILYDPDVVDACIRLFRERRYKLVSTNKTIE